MKLFLHGNQGNDPLCKSGDNKKKVYQAPKSFQSIADYNIILNNNRIHLLTQEESTALSF